MNGIKEIKKEVFARVPQKDLYTADWIINYLANLGHLNLWRDMDTAPRDGERILASTDHGAVYIVWFSLKFQRFVGGFHGIGDDTILIKWMPVPGGVKGETK